VWRWIAALVERGATGLDGWEERCGLVVDRVESYRRAMRS